MPSLIILSSFSSTCLISVKSRTCRRSVAMPRTAKNKETPVTESRQSQILHDRAPNNHTEAYPQQSIIQVRSHGLAHSRSRSECLLDVRLDRPSEGGDSTTHRQNAAGGEPTFFLPCSQKFRRPDKRRFLWLVLPTHRINAALSVKAAQVLAA